MGLFLKVKQKNPFRISFLNVMIICCIAFSVVFYFIGYVNEKAIKNKYNQDKVQLLMQDWESQLKMISDVSVRIASNHEFHPKYFMEDVTKEKSLLNNLKQYMYYLPTTEEVFLYYGDDHVYRSTGTTLDLELFLYNKIENAQERQLLRAELESLNVPFYKIRSDPKVLVTTDHIYVLIVFKVTADSGDTYAMCGIQQDKDDLKKRFDTVAGGINGNFCLYQGTNLLCSNSNEPCYSEQKGVLKVASSDGGYMVCYLPGQENGTQNGMFPYLLILVILDIIFVFIITNTLANRTYAPILSMSRRYKEFISIEEESSRNALEEINYMLDRVLQNNLDANVLILEKQKLLREQLLRLILESRVDIDLDYYLKRIEIQLPGPWFFVLGISFEEEQEVTEEFLLKMQQEVEKLTAPSEEIYVYAVCDYLQKRISVICSVKDRDEKEEVCESISCMAESYSYEPLIGIGNSYQFISNLSASWMESVDEIQLRKKRAKTGRSTGFEYDAKELYGRILVALEVGDEQAAQEGLECYIRQLKQESLSLLMQKYVIVEFLGEVSKLGKQFEFEVSRQDISMTIASKNLNDFAVAAEKVIHEFCKGYTAQKEKSLEKNSNVIYEYVNAHFADYDMSLEKTAEELHVSVAEVRNAILKCTGKTYKEYLILLRVEYAKQLLKMENMSMVEICNKVGYGSISYFIKLFREHTGMTPARYKRGIIKESDGCDEL